MSNVDRRTVLQTIPIAVALPPVWTLQLSLCEKAQWQALARRTLLHRSSSRTIGQAYRLRVSPEETERLLASVTSRLSAFARIASEAEVVHAAIYADYAAARTANVGGWVLSQTEVALAVLSLDVDGEIS